MPNAPTGLAATPGDNQVALTWTAPTVGSPTSYNVLRGTTSGNYPVTNTTSSTSYTDTGLANGTPYYYVVEAVNSARRQCQLHPGDRHPRRFRERLRAVQSTASIPNGSAATGTGEFGTWTCGVTAQRLPPDSPIAGLTVANNAMNVSGSRASVNFTSSLTSGTKCDKLFDYSTSDRK